MLGMMILLPGTVAAFLAARYTSRAFIVRPLAHVMGALETWRHGQTDVSTNMLASEGVIWRAGSTLDAFMDEIVAGRRARQDAENVRELIAQELDHRVKDLFLPVQVAGRQTFTKAGTHEAAAILPAGINAIGHANIVRLNDHWRAALVLEVVESRTSPFSDARANRFTLGSCNSARQQRRYGHRHGRA